MDHFLRWFSLLDHSNIRRNISRILKGMKVKFRQQLFLHDFNIKILPCKLHAYLYINKIRVHCPWRWRRTNWNCSACHKFGKLYSRHLSPVDRCRVTANTSNFDCFTAQMCCISNWRSLGSCPRCRTSWWPLCFSSQDAWQTGCVPGISLTPPRYSSTS
jgi:hypothetical protein